MNGARASTVAATMRISPNTQRKIASGASQRAPESPPQSAREIGDRSAGGREHDQASTHPATFLDHATCSFGVSRTPLARFVTTVEPATSASMPHRRNVE